MNIKINSDREHYAMNTLDMLREVEDELDRIIREAKILHRYLNNPFANLRLDIFSDYAKRPYLRATYRDLLLLERRLMRKCYDQDVFYPITRAG